ncbi:MAG: amidase [Kiloniellales bacterium]|nr:amidase [Kiloniellales bacterium]
MTLAQLTAREAARQTRAGETTSEALVAACLERIAAVDEEIQAWTHFDRNYALEQARRLDERRKSGAACGPLHGVPVGVKDIYDTTDFPTENGTPLNAGRRPERDATVVALLRQAGAVIMGKTVTTELAVYSPGKTRNPHDATRTPGGSSSGSAAAIASHMVPLALGSQTNGSVIRPAAYCGVVGYKPTHGLISRSGVLALSRSLDTVGFFARDVEDVALLADALAGFDAGDPDMKPQSPPRLAEIAAESPPVTPHFAFVKSPVWEHADADTREGFAEIVAFLDEGCDEVTLPEPFNRAVDWHRTVMCADMAKNLQSLYARGKERLSDVIRGMIEDGQRTLALDYLQALAWRDVLNVGLEEIFERYDVIVTPAAPGEAPKGLDATGNPIFCSLWTFCGVPAISLPIMQGSNGLPIGVQLVGQRGQDGRLLRAARWFMDRVREEHNA